VKRIAISLLLFLSHNIKKLALPLLLYLSLLLGELYRLFKTPYINEKAWFLLIDLKQAVTWYVKDTSEGFNWIIFLFVWYVREKKRDIFWAKLIASFLIFRCIDLGIYWLNHRHAGKIYGLCYLSIAIYAGINTIKEYKKHTRTKK
jgi:hypothetical protein